MRLLINRTITNRLYTMGELYINGRKTTSTVEDTLTMLEAGRYQVRLGKCGSNARQIVIIPDHKTSAMVQKAHRFQAGGSHISSRKHLSICMGERLIPGSLKKGSKVYERLFDRLEKAEARKESAVLTISDTHVEAQDPISLWDRPCSP